MSCVSSRSSFFLWFLRAVCCISDLNILCPSLKDVLQPGAERGVSLLAAGMTVKHCIDILEQHSRCLRWLRAGWRAVDITFDLFDLYTV